MAERYTFDNPIAIKITAFDASLDWAVLEVIDRSQPLPETLTLVNEADLNEEESMAVVALHAPVKVFFETEMTELHVWKSERSRVQQFDKNGMSVLCEGGLHSGGSGGPYVLQPGGRVLAMHIGSIDQGREIPRKKLKVKELAEHLSDQSEVAAFAKEGLVVCRIAAIRDLQNGDIN